ncbi:MAG: hypothetical protein AAGE43_13105 [Pseudomonadota bacterium]
MKAIGWLIGIILLVVVGLGVYLVMNAGDLIKTAVETIGPRYLGVEVKLGSAEVSFTEGTGELRGLVIGNPEGFDGPHAFSLGRVALGIDPSAQSESLIVLRNVEVDAADLALVAIGQNTNLQAIMANLEGDGGGSAPAEEPASTGPEPKLIIDNFAFTNARTSLDSDLLGEMAVSVPDIVLEGIGRKSNGVTIREALTQILKPITQASTEALAREGLNVDEIKANAEERVNEELKERIGTDLDGLKDLKNSYN